MKRFPGSAAGSILTVLAWIAIAPTAHVRADVPPPPDSPESKRVPATIEVDWGVFADRVSRRHVIAAGETLRSIAAKELGNASKMKAIVEANPDVIQDPDKIRVGDVIWLPSVKSLETAAKLPTPPVPGPASAPAPTAEPVTPVLAAWYDAFWLENTGHKGRTDPVLKSRATPGEPVKKTLVLLPRLASVLTIAALTKGPVPATPSDIPGALTLGMWADTLVHRDDPTVRIVTTYKLTGVSGTSITTDIARMRYDAEGKVVTKEWVVPPPSRGSQDKETDAKPAPAPTPGPSSGPISPGSPTPAPAGPAMAAAITVTGGGTPPPAPTAPPANDVDGSHWPTSTGLIVALAGAAVVAGLWIYKRSKVPTPPPEA